SLVFGEEMKLHRLAAQDALAHRMNRRRCLRKMVGSVAALASAASLSACGGGGDGGTSVGSALSYTSELEGPFPIPQDERGLQTVVAEPYFHVSSDGLQLEGASFDRQGNLIFVEVFGGRVLKLTPDKVQSTLLPTNALGSAGIGIHKDGRIFVA